VASNIDGYASVITQGVEGLLVRPKDVDALATALLELLSDPDQRREMGEKGRQRAQEYRWDRVSQRVLTYYERLQYERKTRT
jgi:glycosyltransferase involved in cell wall biosynthesis